MSACLSSRLIKLLLASGPANRAGPESSLRRGLQTLACLIAHAGSVWKSEVLEAGAYSFLSLKKERFPAEAQRTRRKRRELIPAQASAPPLRTLRLCGECLTRH